VSGPLRLLLDGNVSSQIAAALRARGYNVTIVGKDYRAMLGDRNVLAIAHRDKRIFLTHDHELTTAIYRQHWPNSGVLAIRSGFDNPDLDTAMTLYTVQRYEAQLEQAAQIVVSERGVRVRRAVEVR
jgi:predicted nuclease of predicted toxin-antitoxin system